MGNRIKFTICLVFLCTVFVLAYPDSGWQYLKSQHFSLTYNTDTEVFSNECLRIAEGMYAILIDYFGYLPANDRINIILRDEDDYPHSSVIVKENTLQVSCRNVPTLYRQEESPLLVDQISYQLAYLLVFSRFRRSMNFIINLTMYDSDINTDVDGAFAYDYYRIPLWFIEGAAQIGSLQYGDHRRDAFREMLLKDAYLNDRLLSLDAMGRFEENILSTEMVKIQSFDFIFFLTRQFVDIPFKELCNSLTKAGFRKSFELTYGAGLESLYESWLADLGRRFADTPASPAGRRIFSREQLLNLEVASTAGGEYVIANWGNDFELYNLFRRQPDGRYREIARDTGMILKQDRGTGVIWFNRKVYNPVTETYISDIYKLGAGDKLLRQTKGSRSLAFDVLDDVLYFAAYNAGVTQIWRRSPGDEDVLLHTLSGASLFSLTVLARDQLLLELADQRGLLLISPEGRKVLWSEYKIIDPVAATAESIFFVSSLSGAPQLYRVSLNHPDSWFQLTGSIGARFPAYDTGTGVLSYSAYVNGSFLRYTLDSPMAAGLLASFPPEQIHPTPPAFEWGGLSEKIHSAGFISVLNTLDIAFRGSLFDKTAGKSMYIIPGIQVRQQNIPGTQERFSSHKLIIPFELGDPDYVFSGIGYDATDSLSVCTKYFDFFAFYRYWITNLTLPFERDQVDIFPALGLKVEFELVPGLFTTFLDFHAGVIPGDIGRVADLVSPTINLNNSFRISPYQDLILDYNLILDLGPVSWELLIKPSHNIDVGWSYYRSPRRIIDPAGLGQGFYSARVNWHQKFGTYPEENWEEQILNFIPRYVCHLEGAFAGQADFWENRVALQGELTGLLNFFSRDDEPWMRGIMADLSDHFFGYPEFYTVIRNLMQLIVTLRINPFVNIYTPTRWYESLHLCCTVQTGILQHFDGSSYALDYPLALSVSYHQKININPVNELIFFIAYTTPLNHFLDVIEEPYSIKIGFNCKSSVA